jgi:hypothetical protein
VGTLWSKWERFGVSGELYGASGELFGVSNGVLAQVVSFLASLLTFWREWQRFGVSVDFLA